MRFRRPSVRYSTTPAPATPYQAAQQLWDERIGGARAAPASGVGSALAGASRVATGGGPTASANPSEAPDWARQFASRQTMTHGIATAAHTVRGADAGGAGANPSLRQED